MSRDVDQVDRLLVDLDFAPADEPLDEAPEAKSLEIDAGGTLVHGPSLSGAMITPDARYHHSNVTGHFRSTR